MRLPVRHAPPEVDAPVRRCAHLEALADASVGLCLSWAAQARSSARSRGRHGNALQWHFGLESHDSAARLDWEDRIELKLVSVWRRADGRVGLDKLKVCDAGVDPRHKLSNVLFVFADRLSRVVLGYRFFNLAGQARASLAQAWHRDPHFDAPSIYIEARETRDGEAGAPRRSAPAYYLSAAWLEATVVPPLDVGLFPFDARWWSEVRAGHRGRSPLATVVPPGGERPGRVRCGRCGAPVEFDPERLRVAGWSPAHHGMPVDGACGLRGHFVVDGNRLPRSRCCSLAEQVSALELREGSGGQFRLADRVLEPDDHGH